MLLDGQMLPAKAMRLEACEVGVARHPDAPLRDGERRMLRVCYMFARRTRRPTQPGDIIEMRRSWNRQTAPGMSHELLDDAECSRERCGVIVDLGARHDSHESNGNQDAE